MPQFPESTIALISNRLRPTGDHQENYVNSVSVLEDLWAAAAEYDQRQEEIFAKMVNAPTAPGNDDGVYLTIESDDDDGTQPYDGLLDLPSTGNDGEDCTKVANVLNFVASASRKFGPDREGEVFESFMSAIVPLTDENLVEELDVAGLHDVFLD